MMTLKVLQQDSWYREAKIQKRNFQTVTHNAFLPTLIICDDFVELISLTMGQMIFYLQGLDKLQFLVILN